MIKDQSGTDEQALPHGGTVRDLRLSIAKLAQRGNEVFERTVLSSPPGPFDPATRELNLMAHGATFHGWALASVLRLIEVEYGDKAAWNAAAMVQMIAMDGGTEGLCDDLDADLPEVERANDAFPPATP
jgi:hypothetical protein